MSPRCRSSRPHPSCSSAYHDGYAGLHALPAPTTQQFANKHGRLESMLSIAAVGPHLPCRRHLGSSRRSAPA
eukprot:6309902-Alexandrium_andersonii.AAC.1